MSQLAFTLKVMVLFALAFADLVINATADHADGSLTSLAVPLSLLGVQLFLQVLIFLVVFMLFSGTFLFQVGLLGILGREFRALLLVIPGYFLVFGAYAACKFGYLLGPQQLTQGGLWGAPLFIALSIFQKAASMVYYVVLLEAGLRLGNPKWYVREPWVRKIAASAEDGGRGAGQAATAVPAPAAAPSFPPRRQTVQGLREGGGGSGLTLHNTNSSSSGSSVVSAS